jgi:hypothetical protein
VLADAATQSVDEWLGAKRTVRAHP